MTLVHCDDDNAANDAGPGPAAPRSNHWIASNLRQAAGLLAAQGANQFRVLVYRQAADAVTAEPSDLRELVEERGRPGLEAISAIGPTIAGAVAEMLATGNWSFLERLKGAPEPDALFGSVPGIGAALAHRVHEILRIESLEELEAAANDGRLEQLAGFGGRRAATVRNTLAERLGRARAPTSRIADEPETAVLLDVDREYREKARRGELRTIAPKRFNPDYQGWLPVLHTTRGAWHFTALYANTAGADRHGRTDDWVVVYFHRDGVPEGRRTIVNGGDADGPSHRVVRGRETELVNDC